MFIKNKQNMKLKLLDDIINELFIEQVKCKDENEYNKISYAINVIINNKYDVINKIK